MAYGQASNIGIIFQNSYGVVGDVSSIHFIPHLSSNLALDIPPMYSENMRGLFDEGDSYEGKRTVSGDIQCEAQPIALGAMLKSILNLDSSVNSGAIYTHNFKPRVSDHSEPSANNPVTVYSYLDTGSAMLYSDLNGTTLELGVANGELLKAKVSYIGGTFSQNASVSASYPVGKRWTWDQSSLTVGGAGKSEIQNLTITLEESIQSYHTLNNSKYPSRLKRSGFRTVSVAGTILFDNQNEFQEFISQNERELVMRFTNNTEIQSGYYEVCEIKLPLMRYEESKPTAEGPGLIEMSVTARGKYSVTSATALQISLTNTQATY